MEVLPQFFEKDDNTQLVGDICTYIDYLKEHLGYHITLHYYGYNMGEHFYRFMPYSYHNCGLCKVIKHSQDVWAHCVSRQDKVCAACREHPILGTCYAGVSEYVFSMYRNSPEKLGFICVSGYTLDKKESIKRALATAERYQLPKDSILAAVDKLESKLPDMETLTAQILPLQQMFSFLIYRKNRQLSSSHFEGVDIKNVLFRRMCGIINFYFGDPDFSMQQLAKILNLNYTYASHVFSECGKTTFSKYLRTLRIETAKQCLAYTDDSISDISAICGFNDSNYFTNTFKMECGLSPSQYRQQNHKDSGNHIFLNTLSGL